MEYHEIYVRPVERAFQNVREAYDDGGYPEFDDPVERLQS
jgi:hypothetical protein